MPPTQRHPYKLCYPRRCFFNHARNGKPLWETNLGVSVSAGPMTYSVNGKQYISIQAGSALFAFALR